jgi:hypothetical protein
VRGAAGHRVRADSFGGLGLGIVQNRQAPRTAAACGNWAVWPVRIWASFSYDLAHGEERAAAFLLLEFPARWPRTAVARRRRCHALRPPSSIACTCFFPSRNCDWVGHRTVDPAAGYLFFLRKAAGYLGLTVYCFLIR